MKCHSKNAIFHCHKASKSAFWHDTATFLSQLWMCICVCKYYNWLNIIIHRYRYLNYIVNIFIFFISSPMIKPTFIGIYIIIPLRPISKSKHIFFQCRNILKTFGIAKQKEKLFLRSNIPRVDAYVIWMRNAHTWTEIKLQHIMRSNDFCHLD